MRNTLILPALVLALAGCGDDGSAEDSFIRASIDGTMWSAASETGTVIDYGGGYDGILAVARRSYGNGYQSFGIVLPLPPDTGTYPMDGVIARGGFISCPDAVLADCIDWEAVPPHPGTFTIDRVEPTTGLIEGRFSFQAYPLGDPDGISRSITSGRFRIYAPSVFILE